jgi:hypothetical protein
VPGDLEQTFVSAFPSPDIDETGSAAGLFGGPKRFRQRCVSDYTCARMSESGRTKLREARQIGIAI